MKYEMIMPFQLGSLIMLALLLIIPGWSEAGGPDGDFPEAPEVTNSIIVRLKGGVPLDEAAVQVFSQTTGESLSDPHPMSGGAFVVQLPDNMALSEVEALATTLSASPTVDYVEPNIIMVPLATPKDDRFLDQWHYFEATGGANLPVAWDNTMGSPTVVAAVIDTGIVTHQDIDPVRVLPGFDFISDITVTDYLGGSTSMPNDGDGRDNDPTDPGDWREPGECGIDSNGLPRPIFFERSDWHGTHVAGTVGAATNNNAGVSGVNWVSRILPVRVMGKCGGYTSDIVDGMRWAAGLPLRDPAGQPLKDASGQAIPVNPNPAHVLNLSLGADLRGLDAADRVCGRTYQDAIDEIIAKGTVVVVAAGNNNADAADFRPANCDGVITVAATDRDEDKALYSNFGDVVKISAPGGETTTNAANGVLSTLNTGTRAPVPSPGGDTFKFYEGTSMAAPHVTGIVSLMQSVNPLIKPSRISQILQNTANPFPGGSSCTTSTCGPGIVDAAAALQEVLVNAIPNNLVGDNDNFQPGDPVDVPPRSQRVQAILDFIEGTGKVTGQNAAADLDVKGFDRPVGLTHFFTLPDQARITSAKVTLRLRGNSSLVKNDQILYDMSVSEMESSPACQPDQTNPGFPMDPANCQIKPFVPFIALRDLSGPTKAAGVEPQAGEIYQLEIDLSKVPVRTSGNGPGESLSPRPDDFLNLLPLLVDGQFDIVITDDVTVDFSELTIVFVGPLAPAGDFNGDGKVDRGDLNILLAGRNTLATDESDPRDLDGDRKITVHDVRKLIVLCWQNGQPRCAK